MVLQFTAHAEKTEPSIVDVVSQVTLTGFHSKPLDE
jgi:hypothetical protein